VGGDVSSSSPARMTAQIERLTDALVFFSFIFFF